MIPRSGSFLILSLQGGAVCPHPQLQIRIPGRTRYENRKAAPHTSETQSGRTRRRQSSVEGVSCGAPCLIMVGYNVRTSSLPDDNVIVCIGACLCPVMRRVWDRFP
jgi:hypothetical protein